ncbi:TetR/AcrR family transcriptional regulator C-terminal domain-containing protein [Streptomyces chartreusis]|uniref:TetR/AcrR family transcriptional regulator C-terminal domain-containing protein n=1 Tax=Streptomyces chartreusis TaxID=1969 RepID=UPI00367F32AA
MSDRRPAAAWCGSRAAASPRPCGPSRSLPPRSVARINAEGENFPGDLHDAWQKAGPLRVQRTLAARMARLAESGLLHVRDSELAAQHFVVLVTNTWSRGQAGVDALTDAETHDIAAAGVHAFLYGYLPRDGG